MTQNPIDLKDIDISNTLHAVLQPFYQYWADANVIGIDYGS